MHAIFNFLTSLRGNNPVQTHHLKPAVDVVDTANRYNRFLCPSSVQLTLEEVMTTTAYLDLFLRSVTEPALLHTFLSFILLHHYDNVQVLDTLVSRINTPFQVQD